MKDSEKTTSVRTSAYIIVILGFIAFFALIIGGCHLIDILTTRTITIKTTVDAVECDGLTETITYHSKDRPDLTAPKISGCILIDDGISDLEEAATLKSYRQEITRIYLKEETYLKAISGDMSVAYDYVDENGQVLRPTEYEHHLSLGDTAHPIIPDIPNLVPHYDEDDLTVKVGTGWFSPLIHRIEITYSAS